MKQGPLHANWLMPSPIYTFRRYTSLPAPCFNVELTHLVFRPQIAHRDIKPANVLLDKTTKTVKVTDFGVSRVCSH